MFDFIWLIFAHFIGDWGLQTEWMAENKGKWLPCMIAHSAIWAACVCVALRYIGLAPTDMQISSCALFLAIFHGFIDKWKCILYDSGKIKSYHIYVDQASHFLQLLFVYIVLKPYNV